MSQRVTAMELGAVYTVIALLSAYFLNDFISDVIFFITYYIRAMTEFIPGAHDFFSDFMSHIYKTGLVKEIYIGAIVIAFFFALKRDGSDLL